MSHGNAPFGDGQEIIYVNGEYKGDEPIGRLVHDMWCKDADDMYYPERAEKVRYYKSTEKGRAEMSEWEKKFHNEGIVEERLRAIKSIMESLNVTAQRAMEILKIPAEEQQKYATLIL